MFSDREYFGTTCKHNCDKSNQLMKYGAALLNLNSYIELLLTLVLLCKTLIIEHISVAKTVIMIIYTKNMQLENFPCVSEVTLRNIGK